MRSAATARLTTLDAAVEDARENAGDVEVRDALAAKATYICDTGEMGGRKRERERRGGS